MKKKILLILFVVCFLWRSSAIGATAPQKVTSAVVPLQKTASTATSSVESQQVEFGVCYKIFKLDNQRLFYLTLASVNANRFNLDEIQSQSGYVLFSVAKRQFLATIVKIDSKSSMLKITPCNNVYYFPVGIVQNMFKYIELNVNTPVEKLSVL